MPKFTPHYCWKITKQDGTTEMFHHDEPNCDPNIPDFMLEIFGRQRGEFHLYTNVTHTPKKIYLHEDDAILDNPDDNRWCFISKDDGEDIWEPYYVTTHKEHKKLFPTLICEDDNA